MPRSPRFYSPGEFASGEKVSLSSDDAHHARNVLRLRGGAAVELFNGSGKVALAVLDETRGQAVDVTIAQVVEIPPPSPVMTIATAMPKGKRWRWLLEKCTELGATTIQPIHFAHSTAKGEGTPEKWHRWAVEASKQCRRAWIPKVPAALPLTAFLAAPQGEMLILACLGGASPQVLAPLQRDTESMYNNIKIIIGPEAGVNAAEAELCRAAGARRICFARDILRIETAALAACAIVGSL